MLPAQYIQTFLAAQGCQHRSPVFSQYPACNIKIGKIIVDDKYGGVRTGEITLLDNLSGLG